VEARAGFSRSHYVRGYTPVKALLLVLHDLGFCVFIIYAPHPYIIFEDTFFYLSVRHYHFTNAMLDSNLPLTLIIASISPFHSSLTMTFVIMVRSFIDIPT
jgi:hypothetical protein